MQPGEKQMRGFLLDTNVFNHLVEGKISKEDLPIGFPIFVTHLQRDEIWACQDKNKKEKMLGWLNMLPDHIEPTNTLVLGVSRIGAARIGNGVTYQKILDSLSSRKKRKNKSHIHDALIGELAIERGFILVTNDQDLASTVIALGGVVHDVTRLKGKTND